MPRRNLPSIGKKIQAEIQAKSAEARVKPLSAPPIEQQLTLAERNSLATNKLGERYDALNKAIGAAEHKLKELKPPYAIWVYYNSESLDGQHGGGPYSYDLLGLSKINNQWRLSHAYDRDDNEKGPYGIEALSECPVEIRLQAIKQLHELQAKIVETKEKFIPLVEEAVHEVLSFCQGGEA